MDDVFDNPNEKSEFNSGLSIVYRLDAIAKQLALARVDEDWFRLFKWLKNFYFELRPHFNQKEKVDHDAKFEYIKGRYIVLHREISKGKCFVWSSELDDFDYWEMELRDLQDAHNLGMPKQSDARFALAGGR